MTFSLITMTLTIIRQPYDPQQDVTHHYDTDHFGAQQDATKHIYTWHNDTAF